MFSVTAMPVKLPSEKKKKDKLQEYSAEQPFFTSLSSLAGFLECRVLTWRFIFVGQHMGRHGNPVRRGQIGIDKKKSNNNCEVVCCSWTHRPGGAWSSANAVD